MKFEDYKSQVQQTQWDSVLGKLEELLLNVYGEHSYFYVKNLVNINKNELYFFYEEKIVTVTFNDNHSNFELIEYNNSIVRMKLNYSLNHGEYTILSIKLDSGEEFLFNSLEDSNEHWENKYETILKGLLETLNVKNKKSVNVI